MYRENHSGTARQGVKDDTGKLKLDFEQRRESVLLEARVISDPEWAAAELVHLRALLHSSLEQLQQADHRNGYCMCGEAMAGHSGMSAALVHIPEDSGARYARTLMERIEQSLGLKREGRHGLG